MATARGKKKKKGRKYVGVARSAGRSLNYHKQRQLIKFGVDSCDSAAQPISEYLLIVDFSLRGKMQPTGISVFS